jgi:purine-cytosine permease-like protein
MAVSSPILLYKHFGLTQPQICARFSMGWWPVKICVLLNLVVLIGYSMIDAVVAGQILSAVSPNGSLTVEVGIAITAIVTWLVTTFGIKLFHHYERSVIPNLVLGSFLTSLDTPGYLKASSSSFLQELLGPSLIYIRNLQLLVPHWLGTVSHSSPFAYLQP